MPGAGLACIVKVLRPHPLPGSQVQAEVTPAAEWEPRVSRPTLNFPGEATADDRDCTAELRVLGRKRGTCTRENEEAQQLPQVYPAELMTRDQLYF